VDGNPQSRWSRREASAPSSDYADPHILLSLLPLTDRTPFTKDILTAYHPKNIKLYRYGYHSMITISDNLIRHYDRLLNQHPIVQNQQPYYRKWLRFYLDFCHKYTFDPNNRDSFAPFNKKLQKRGQSEQHKLSMHRSDESIKLQRQKKPQWEISYPHSIFADDTKQ